MRIRALDSIRGLLLLQMTLDHFGEPISRFLYQSFGFFTAAEGFFFLSGFVGILAVKSKLAKGQDSSWMRKRAVRIWKYHIATVLFVTFLAIVLFPSLRSYVEGLIEHPLSGGLLVASLIYTPSWLDVLPLYVFLLLIGSFILPFISRGRLLPVWGISFGLWLVSQLGLREWGLSFLPSWSYPGFFDLFSWQFVYFSGATISALWKDHLQAKASQGNWYPILSIGCVLFCLFCGLWSHGLLPIAQPSEFWVSREHLGFIRILDFFTFVVVISWIVRHKAALLDFPFTATLGRHSLEIYACHTLMIYFWLATPTSVRYTSPWNIVVPIAACIFLWGIAKSIENHSKTPKQIK